MSSLPRQPNPQAQMYEVPVTASLTLSLEKNTATNNKDLLEVEAVVSCKQDNQNPVTAYSSSQDVHYMNLRHHSSAATTSHSTLEKPAALEKCFIVNSMHIGLYKLNTDSKEQNGEFEFNDHNTCLFEDSTDSWVALAKNISGDIKPQQYTTACI